MSEDSYPQPYPVRNGGSLNVVESQTLLGAIGGSGIIGYPADCAVTASGTGLQVTVATGSAILQGTYYVAAAANVLAVAANPSSSVRTDRVVLRLTKSTGLINAVVISGTPGAGQPAILNDGTHFDWPLAEFTVPSNGVASNVTDERRWLASGGTASAAANPPLYPTIGHTWYQTDSGDVLTWNGTTWGSPNVSGDWGEWSIGSSPIPVPGAGVFLQLFSLAHATPTSMVLGNGPAQGYTDSAITFTQSGRYLVSLQIEQYTYHGESETVIYINGAPIPLRVTTTADSSSADVTDNPSATKGITVAAGDSLTVFYNGGSQSAASAADPVFANQVNNLSITRLS